MEKANDKYVFHVLGGPTYSEEDRPQHWHNKVRLVPGNPPAMKKLPLQQFPLIENFQVILEEMRKTQEQKSLLGYHVCFSSPSRGYIANFPWWDHVEKEMRRDDFSIPLGDFKKPFLDLEQGWEIVIAEHEGYVYVLQGIGRQWYDTWFKVSTPLYLSTWHKAIQMCRRMGGE
jgi:hypothetical protein